MLEPVRVHVTSASVNGRGVLTTTYHPPAPSTDQLGATEYELYTGTQTLLWFIVFDNGERVDLPCVADPRGDGWLQVGFQVT
jgi:hypothetical protein